VPSPALAAIETSAIEILDIGAAVEGEDRYEPLLANNLARVTGFEPNSVALRHLQSLNRPSRQYLPHFVGRGGPARFHFTHWSGCSSLYEPDPAAIELFTSIGALPPDGNYAVTATAAVETVRLDDVADVPACDYLKADVQGAELDVLEGASKVLAHAVVLELEVEFVPLYKNQPLFGEIQVFLRDCGYVLHKFIDIGGRPFRPFQVGANPREPMSQLLFADAVFVRDFTRLDGYTDEGLIKAAAILHLVYHSHDIAHLLLTEHDRRTGSRRAGQFMEALGRMPQLPRLFMNLKTDA
jgi:FkbM family methyltransferase